MSSRRLPVGHEGARARRHDDPRRSALHAHQRGRRISTCRSAPARTSRFWAASSDYIVENERYFKEYVVNYTNAPAIICDEFQDTEDLDGLFSGWDEKKGQYDMPTWMYKDVDPEPAGGARESEAGEGQPTQRSRFRPSTPIPRCRIRAASSRS